MAFAGFFEKANEEYAKAIEAAQNMGLDEEVQALRRENVLSLSDLGSLECHRSVHPQVEEYISSGGSSYKMYACLGIICLWYRLDLPAAKEAFEKAIALESRDIDLVYALILALWEAKDFEGILELFNGDNDDITNFRIRGVLQCGIMQERIFYSARKVNKTNLLIKCYEREMARAWDRGQQNKFRIVEESFETTGWRNQHMYYPGGNELLSCWLALLHRKYLGQSDVAIQLWKTAFFKNSDLFKLCELSSEYYDVIPDFFEQFAELLYDKALGPDGSIDNNTLTTLERLKRRYDAFQGLRSYDRSIRNQKDINLLLSKLYLRCGKLKTAQELLNEQFQAGVEILKDDVSWNDSEGYAILSKILFASGRSGEAGVALSVSRFERFEPEKIIAKVEQEINTAPESPECSETEDEILHREINT